MLRELIKWVLNNYLSNYVENLSIDQLSVALLQGEVELENVPLRKDALHHLGLPVEIRSGLIGRVRLQIPVRQIRTAPWVIIFEQLYLVAGPYKLEEFDAKLEEQSRQDYKLRKLDALEAMWRAEHQAEIGASTSFYSSSCSSWVSYTSGLVTNIVENLQLKIRDVHIRYEDNTTVPGCSLAAGLTLRALSAQTCDSKWMPGYVPIDSALEAFKLVELTDAAIYWDTQATMLGDLPLAELAIAMQPSQLAKKPDQTSFVLSPVSAQARLKRNRTEQPLRLRTQPRVVCDLILDSMQLSISDVQYGQMVNLLRGLDTLSIQREAEIYQSSCPHTDARSLWRWASYRAVTLSRVSSQYIELYTQYLLTPTTISTDSKQLKDTIEIRYEYEVLRELREIAMQNATSKITEDIQSKGWNVPGRGLLVQWFPLWTGWYSTPAAQQELPLRSPDDSQMLEDELLHALSDTVESTSLIKRDAVFAVSTLTLKQGSFRLFSSTKPTDPVEEDEGETKGTPRYAIMEVELESLKVQLELRPRFNSQSFSFSVGGIYLRDCLTRNSLFPMVVEPQQQSKEIRSRTTSTPIRTSEPLFKLLYEVKPFNSKVDYKLHIESRSLTVVYNPNVVKAITDFFTHPTNLTHKEPTWHLGQAARFRYETMKRKTKERILQNWEEILEGDHRNRSKWDIKLNISAPQIVFAENFCDKSATVVLVDFGKLNVRNIQDDSAPSIMVSPARQESEEDECFHTPCSSPQTEQVYEDSKSPTFLSPKHDHVTEMALHQKMYDRYSIELGDMQILVGRTRDNIKHAHLKGTSTLHVLDRFNISIQLERRALYSNDPSLPSLKLSGNLPKLVVHVNEQKVAALRSMIYHICGEGLPSPFRPQESSPIHQKYEETDTQTTPEPFREISENACLFVLRFCIDDMSLEVQSRGRCVAELQVKGVKAGLIKRPYETSSSLSIHSLLLVDAMQTYGNDFDLLVASHQRVGMDSVSGSLFDSEPTSPTSPASPDPIRGLGKTTSPIALTQALSSLQFSRAISPIPTLPHHTSVVQDFDPPDSEALISIELVFLGPGCPSLEEGEESKHIATVHFNYLDIIANQETIVELVGFVKRLFPESKSHSSNNRFIGGSSIDNLTTEPMAKIEIMFDFQRLNVLLLRAIVKDNVTQARKIATATLTEAKIQATVGNDLVVKGSLGGLQVLDLTPEGQKHQRILSLGHDPLVHASQDHHTELLNRLTAELSSMYQHSASPGAFRQDSEEDDKEAFSFTIIRPLDEEATENSAEINMRMASVWYTHSPQFLEELQSCATEFKQYITNLARSIRSAATEMAMGLVHARAEALAERLYSSRGSLAGPSLEMSPQRRRRRSMSQSLEFLESKFNTPYTPDEDNSNTDFIMDMKLDIVLESPVIVLPRSQSSSDVFVAHLGKITLNDQQNQDAELPSNVVSPDSDSHSHYCWGIVRRRAKYNLEIRDMNLSSLNIESRRKQPDIHQECPLQRADVLYSCEHNAFPILHDTLIKLTIELDRGRSVMKPTESLPSLLMDQSMDFLDVDSQDVVQIRGSVVQPLKVSLSRAQYEQLIDCVNQITGGNPTSKNSKDGKPDDDNKPESLLSIDPSLRARLLGTQPPVTTPLDLKNTKHKFILKVFFELPELSVILRGNLHGIEQNMVEIAFGDFIVRYDKSDPYETSIKMSLRSLVVEDLLQSEASPHRKLVVSQFVIQEDTALESIRIPLYASKSCPDFGMQLGHTLQKRNSLPDRLETSFLYGIMKPTTQTQQQMKTSPTGEYPCTPPPSPRNTSSPQDVMSRKDNLVHIDVQLVDPKSPEFFSRHNANQRYVDINFNCLDLIVNIESWVMILDFFGMGTEQETTQIKKPKVQTQQLKCDESVNSELEIKIRSLTLVLTRASGGELARANVSQLTAHTEKRGLESSTSGKLGKLSLLDLTPHGRLYRERFTTTGGEALDFHILNHSRPDVELTREFDTQVRLKMSSVHYVHTQRFIEELKTQFTHFSVLQTLVSKLRAAASGNLGEDHATRGRRILWDIQAASPVILLPLSSKSNKVLVADLGELTVTNKFSLKIHEITSCLIDVMSIDLINMDLFSGHRITSLDSHDIDKSSVLHLGIGTYVEKIGTSFLNEKCHLQLKVERNLDSLTCHPVPDLSIHGTLSTLHAVLGLDQYQLVRGLLIYNIGENLDDIEDLLPPPSPICSLFSQSQLDLTWVFNCLKLDLLNVTVSLQDNQKEPLACINFITCRLVIESRSDGSRDIDLVSKEILLSDTRFSKQPVNKRSNVFTSILQPVDVGKRSSQVQAEIHHRRKLDGTQFTILLNNMRLMLILDWWEIVRDFIFTDPEKQEIATPAKIQDDTTSRPATVQEYESPFELKLNITDSEVVVVEDTSQWDSNAVILKSTTVISYRPNVKERPLSCNLNRCELFYCILGLEEETALSIVDPVTVNMEIAQRDNLSLGLDITLQSMRLRLSYHDFRMFSQMLRSLPKQTKEAIRKRDSVSEKSRTNEKPANVISQINKLRGLGFSPEDCANALDECGGKLDDAALWLTQHATHVEPIRTPHSPDEPPSNSLFNIEAIEVKTNHLSICVIDDCRDIDIPILEISLSQLSLCQNLVSSEDSRTLDKGQMTSILAADYYNRVLSGWEPMIEPWRCEFSWDWQYLTGKPYFRLQIDAEDLLALNITNSLLQLYTTVKESWAEDYLAMTRARSDSQIKALGYRRRSPFVPFALYNDTGSDLWFTTNVTMADRSYDPLSQDLPSEEGWIQVEKGATIPFTFEARRLKLRHGNTHEMKLHQVRVRIAGWQTVQPVSVDRVGIYFRHAQPDLNQGSMPSARVVFQVTLEGSAKKLVTVRSALQITNSLTNSVELKMDNRDLQVSIVHHQVIDPGQTYAVPLPLVHATLRVRPITEINYQHSSQELQWSHLADPGGISEELYCCRPTNSHSNQDSYRFTLAVRREMYPPEKQYPQWMQHRNLMYMYPQPAHTLVLLSPIVVDNLLPLELECSVTTNNQVLRISPGKSAALNLIDISVPISMQFLLENFTTAGQLELLQFGGATKLSNLFLTDSLGRHLQLTAKVRVVAGKGCKISISAPYWLLNRTGLPLVFKQEGASLEAAGQGREHELARMVAPLLFSLADPDHGAGLVVRVGTGVHLNGRSEWSTPLLPRRDVQVRQLRVSTNDTRSDHIYELGISSKPGRGRYRKTTMVHLSPRYLLHNKSSFELQFAQSCLATTVTDPGAEATFLRAVSGCCLPFHWPRLDKEHRLCVRLIDVSDCTWSGSFYITKVDTFHLNIRDKSGKMNFILVEVTQQDASFVIIFSDADSTPPPIRIDNFSEVPIVFYQGGARVQQSVVRPHCSVPYALDEPILPQKLTCIAPGGNETSFDMNNLKQEKELTYENFIYIALSWTFPKDCQDDTRQELQCQQLVLDVPEGQRVILRRKEQGCRSQLWRMTADGHLQHEGSSPPRDPRKEDRSEYSLVLDIAGPAPQPSQYVPLVIRRPDPRRQSTQTWRFTEDGRLCCAHNNMCVQAKDGFFGLRRGSEAVLGPPQPTCHQLNEDGVPVEQAVSRQRLRPGSGILTLRVVADGPTRALEICDKKAKHTFAMMQQRDWAHLAHTSHPQVLHGVGTSSTMLAPSTSRTSDQPQRGTNVASSGWELRLRLVSGLGVSLVDTQAREELAFCLLQGLSVRITLEHAVQRFDAQVLNIQVDNQMCEAQCPVVVYVPNSGRAEDFNNLPVIEISAERIVSEHHNIDTIKHLWVLIRNLNITIEEEQLLLVLALLGLGVPETEPDSTATAAGADGDWEAQRGLTVAAELRLAARKYFFSTLLVKPSQIRLGAVTSSKLAPRLKQMRRRLGLVLIKFEDAAVDLQPFVVEHAMLSQPALLDHLAKHFQAVVKGQLPIILFSSDMLGGPVGLVTNVSEGVIDVINDPSVRSVGDLVKNVTHGISNSAAKVTGSLSDGLGWVALDETHEEIRQKILKKNPQQSSSFQHLKVGFRSFAFGVLGGATSIFTQTYEGIAVDGPPGLISGLGKGIVGTVTKPVMGALDFASEVASAVRDSSRSSRRVAPSRVRLPRCVVGPGGLLPVYSAKQSEGQTYLHQINNNLFSETFMAYEHLRSGTEDLRVIVSSDAVRVFTCSTGGTTAVVIKVHLGELQHCRYVRENDPTHPGRPLHYIELAEQVESVVSNEVLPLTSEPQTRKPRVRCDTEDIAKWVSQQINYAKGMYEEKIRTLVSLPEIDD